jgi:hypothetical protein
MAMVYHWSDGRANFALDTKRPVARRLRPILRLTLWAALIVVPWAALSLVAWSLLNLVPVSS